jgi:hypothetical protein
VEGILKQWIDEEGCEEKTYNIIEDGDEEKKHMVELRMHMK